MNQAAEKAALYRCLRICVAALDKIAKNCPDPVGVAEECMETVEKYVEDDG